MIAKDSGIGKSFMGLASYLATGKGGQEAERVTWSEGVNVSTDDIKAAACEMRMTAFENTRVTKPVYHFSVNWHPHESDKVDQELAMKVVRATLDDLGLSEHQAMVVAHHDREHFHVHCMVNRIHPDTLKGQKQGLSKITMEKTMARLSLEHGFEIVPGRHNAAELHIEKHDAANSLPSEAIRYEERTGQDSDLTRAREALMDPLQQAKSWDDLVAKLKDQGYAAEAAGRGLVLRNEERGYIKASAIDRAYSRGALEHRFEETFAEYKVRTGEGIEAEAILSVDPPSLEDVLGSAAADQQAPAQVENTSKKIQTPERALIDKVQSAVNATLKEAAPSWTTLNNELSRRGVHLEKRGRGLAASDSNATVKMSEAGRAFSIGGLEKQLAAKFDDRILASRPEVSREIADVMKQLGEVEKATSAILAFGEKYETVMDATKKSQDLVQRMHDQRKQIKTSLKRAYDDPAKAWDKFEALKKKTSMKRAIETIEKDPSKLGRLKGGRMIVANQERKIALKHAKSAVTNLKEYRDSSIERYKNKKTFDRDMARRREWEGRKVTTMAELTRHAGSDPWENHTVRVGLEKQLLKLTEGHSIDELKDGAPGTRLQRQHIAATVSELRNEGTTRHTGQFKDILPPMTAGPELIKDYEAARNYVQARAKYEAEIFKSGKNGKPVPKHVREKVEAAANKIVNDQPDAMRVLSRFGRGREQLMRDATKIPLRQRARNVGQRLAKLQAQFKETGRGAGVVLSLFQKR